MNYSRKAVGLLKSQYLSVLKKCALINAGLFILSAPAMAAETTSVLDALKNGGTYTMSKDEDISLTSNIKIEKNTTINGESGKKDDYSLTLENKKITVTDNYSLELENINSLSLNTEFNNSGNLKLENVKKFINENKIKNNGKIELINVNIKDNTAHNDGNIQNEGESSKLVLDNVTFDNNIATDNGLIYNNNGSLETTENRTTFTNNTATKNGLIYNKKSITNLNAYFNKNIANGNGLIYNNSDKKNNKIGTIEKLVADFIDNKVNDTGSLSGIVYNNGEIKELSGKYIGNKTTDGGAIYNQEGSITLTDVEFTNNSATTQGGAIYNASADSIINIIGKVLFSGNKANGVSNALYNNGGTVNIESGDVIFADAIDGSSGKINIKTASADDVVTISNAVNGNNVNLEKGVLNLRTSKATFADNVSLNANGGSLDLQDTETNEHKLGQVTLTKDLDTALDINLGDIKGDVLDAASVSGDSKVVVKDIKVLADTTAHITKIKIASETIKESVKLDDNLEAVETGDNRYLVEYETDENSGNLKFGNDKALETAVQFKKADKNHKMTDTATIEVDLGKLVGSELTINGQGNTIDGNGKKGMELANDQTLNLNDVSFKGFDGSFVNNEGTINLKSDTKSDIDSEISGNGTINVSGTGDVNINSNINAGQMTVSAGNLELKSGAELGGVQDFVMNGGVLNVDDKTISLKNATFNDGSTVAIKVKSNGNGLINADSLTVNGGSLKATLGQGIVEKGSKTVTLLKSGTAFVDNFDSVADNNMYRFEKAEKAGDYIISLAKTAEEVSQENGGTKNNADAAKGWVDEDKFADGTTSADVADKLADLAQNDAKGFNEALSALAPADAPLVRTISVNHNNQVFSAVSRQLDDSTARQKAYGLASGDTALLDGVGVWAQVMDNRIKLDDNARAYGFEVNDYGVALGVEKQLSSSVKAGVGYSYFNDDADAYLRDVDVDTHTAFIYGEYRPNNWYVNGTAAYGWSDYNETKRVAGNIYKAKYDVDNIGAQVMTGYNASVAKVDVTPEAGLRYNNIHRDNYVDGAGQAVKAKTMDVLTAVAGVKAGKDLVSCFGARSFYWRPEARLAATYDLISDKESAVVGLSNGSSYVVDGQRVKRFGVEAGAGVTFYFTPKVEGTIGYEGKFRTDYKDHTGYANLKYKF